MKFIPVYIYFIVISFIVSLLVYSPNRTSHNYLKIFPPFLFLTFVAELYGSYLSSKGKNNVPLYNFFSIIEFSFYFIVLSRIISSEKVKKTLQVIIIPFIALTVCNILFVQGMKSFHTVTYSIGCLIIVSFCIYYFLELFRLPKSVELSKNPAFWICSGLLFFYCCGFPLYGLMNYWGTIKWVIESFDGIVTILNIFLYSLFTIAFLCSRTRKYILSSS